MSGEAAAPGLPTEGDPPEPGLVDLELLRRAIAACTEADSVAAAIRAVLRDTRGALPWGAAQFAVNSPGGGLKEPYERLVHDEEIWRLARTRDLSCRVSQGVSLLELAEAQGPLWLGDLGDLDGRQRHAVVFPVTSRQDTVAAVALFDVDAQHVGGPSRLLDAARILGELIGAVRLRELDRERERATASRLGHEIDARSRELVSARNAAVAADRARSAFLAAISHDLRTPIHGSLAAIHLARTADDRSLPELLDTAAVGMTELLERLDELLDLARPPDYANLDPVPARLPSMFSHAMGTYENLSVDSQSALRVELDSSIEREVLLHKAGFLHMMDSLFAFFATVRTEREVRLAVSWADDTIELVVTGCPDPVGRSAWPLVEQAVTSVGGSFDISSAPPAGVDITIRVPAVATGTVRHGRGKRVLLVDDTAVTRQLGEAMIRTLGFQVDSVDGGQAAIAAVATRPYGVVLMDLRMAGVDGLAATRAIRSGEAGAAAQEIPVVALTADAATGARENALLAGMDDFVAKPFNREQLGEVLQRFLG